MNLDDLRALSRSDLAGLFRLLRDADEAEAKREHRETEERRLRDFQAGQARQLEGKIEARRSELAVLGRVGAAIAAAERAAEAALDAAAWGERAAAERELAYAREAAAKLEAGGWRELSHRRVWDITASAGVDPLSLRTPARVRAELERFEAERLALV